MGKKATLTIPLPTSIAASAHSTIPLWYFDEKLGLWKQEGLAIKSGNSYSGQVSHFSYWNCDVSSNFVRFNCTIIDRKGIPLQNTMVKISVVGQPQTAGYGYTDSTGYVGGAIPENAQLLMEVLSDNRYATPLYGKNFSTTNRDIALGTITTSNSIANIATITGKVVNCSSVAVTKGYVIMIKDNLFYRCRLDSSGSFKFSTALCSGNTQVSIITEDIAALKGGKPMSVTLVAGENVLGSLTACNGSILEFINYSINRALYSTAAPADMLFQSLSSLSDLNGQ